MILLFRPEVGHDDAVGTGAMESAGLGAAVSHRAVLACREERPATAQNQHRLGTADDAASVSLQAARRDYGVWIEEGTYAIDWAKTGELRKA